MKSRILQQAVVIFATLVVLLPVVRYLDHYGLASTSTLVSELNSSDSDTVMHGLYYLQNRVDPAGVPKAIELLKSSDDYVWLNAALYLGECNRPEAIPYLIKVLRHTAWRSDSETQKYLRKLTGQDFGPDSDRWVDWWEQQPEFQPDFDWNDHLGSSPRLERSSQP